MKIYQNSFHTINFKDLDLDFDTYFFKKPDNKFFLEYYRKFS